MANHQFIHGGTGCCAVCDDLPGEGEHAPKARAINYFLPAPTRVSLVARKAGLRSKTLIDYANVVGVPLKSASSKIEGVCAEALIATLMKAGNYNNE